MKASALLGILSAVSSVQAAKGINWGPCGSSIVKPNTSTQSIDCASLPAPLDYTNPECKRSINLDLLRVRAKKGKSKGSILFNFGGPGDNGRDSMLSQMDTLMSIVENKYDLVVFDTRGTVKTLSMTCMNDTARVQYTTKLPTFSNSSDVALGQTWAVQGQLAEECYTEHKDIGSLVGTSFIARDMMTIVDALGEDGLLRYWGMSYGTVLGATAAAMFPNRTERLVLDGVVNAHEYYHSYDEQMHLMADKSFSGFFKGCVAAPSACALAEKDKTAVALEKQFWDFLFKTKFEPVRSGLDIVDYSLIKNVIVGSLYSAASFPKLAKALADLYSGNLTTIIAMDALLKGKADTTVTPDANPGIQCSDKAIRTPHFKDMLPKVNEKYAISRTITDSLVFSDMVCAQWKMNAKERYNGDFKVNTKKPLLFIGNTFDPMTPYQSALNMSTGFNGSSAIEQNSFGHGSVAQASACTIKAIRRYLADGKVPPSGTKCEPDVKLFSNSTILDALKLADKKS